MTSSRAARAFCMPRGLIGRRAAPVVPSSYAKREGAGLARPPLVRRKYVRSPKVVAIPAGPPAPVDLRAHCRIAVEAQQYAADGKLGIASEAGIADMKRTADRGLIAVGEQNTRGRRGRRRNRRSRRQKENGKNHNTTSHRALASGSWRSPETPRRTAMFIVKSRVLRLTASTSETCCQPWGRLTKEPSPRLGGPSPPLRRKRPNRCRVSLPTSSAAPQDRGGAAQFGAGALASPGGPAEDAWFPSNGGCRSRARGVAAEGRARATVRPLRTWPLTVGFS